MKLRNLHSRELKTLFTEDEVDDLRAKLDSVSGGEAPPPEVPSEEPAVLPDEDMGEEELDLGMPGDDMGEEMPMDAPPPMDEAPPIGEEPLDLGGEDAESIEPEDPWEEISRGSKEYAELVDNAAGRIFSKFNMQRIFKLSPEFSNEQELYLSIEPYASNPQKSLAKLKDEKGDVKSWGVVTDDTAMGRIDKAKKIANDRLGVNPEAPPEPEGAEEPLDLGEPGIEEPGIEEPGAELGGEEPEMGLEIPGAGAPAPEEEEELPEIEL